MNKNISSAWLLRKRNGWMSSCRHTITRTNGFASGISGVIVLFHRSKKNPSWKPSSYKFDWSLKWCHCRIMGWIWLDYIYIYMYIFRKCRLDDSELVMGMGNEWCLLFFLLSKEFRDMSDWIPQRLETLNKGVSGSWERIFALGEVLQHASGSKDGLFVLLLLRSFKTQSMMVSFQTMFGICNS